MFKVNLHIVGGTQMKTFVRASLLLIASIHAYGQGSTLDQTTYIYEANQPLYNLYENNPNNWNNVDWYNSDSTFQWTTSSDDYGTQINLNFDWERWDQTFSTAWQSSNGCLSFTGICYNYISDDDGYIENTLYPLWTDLIAEGADSKMAYYGDNEKMIFGWYNMWEFYRESNNSFEVILWADSSYEYRYGSLDILNHNVYIGEEGNNNQEGGKVLNEYLYFNRSLVNYGFDQHLANINITLEGASLYAEANTYTYTPPDPCDSDPQYSPDCAGYVEPYDETEDLTGLLTGTDLIFGDEPSDFYGLGTTSTDTDYGYNDGTGYDETGNFVEEDYTDTSNDFIDESYVTATDETMYDPIDETSYDTFTDTGGAFTESDVTFTDPVDIVDVVEESIFDDTEYIVLADDIFTEEEIIEEPLLVTVDEESDEIVEERVEQADRQESKGEKQIREALEIVSSLGVLGDNPAFNIPGTVDPVAIALATATTEQTQLNSMIAEQISTETYDIDNNQSMLTATPLFAGTSVTENTIENTEVVTEENIQEILAEESSLENVLSAEELLIVENTLEENSGNDTNSDSSFDFGISNDSSITVNDPTLVSSFIMAEIENNDSQQSTDEEVVETIIANSNVTGTTLDSQFDQLLATGATTIGQVVSGEQPDYSKYDVKSIPQDEQQTLAKAEKQLETMNQNDVDNNLDRLVEEMQEAGGFNNNQSLTLALMARVPGFGLYNTVLTDRGGWYTPKDVYVGNRPTDNTQNLRLLLTDDRHQALVNLQYE